ncbi:MAG: DEAD/DEAH box helicase family protein [Bacteroidota bacterium]
MAKRKKDPSQLDLIDIGSQLRTAVCVPAIRREVSEWRNNKYKGATATSQELLNFWFRTDHTLANRVPFKFHVAQREAIETLIYLYEVKQIHTRTQLLETYAANVGTIRLPTADEFTRYAVKMATGSGKTLVMSLAIVWQYANAIREDAERYAKTFLVIAPNVIVFERLKLDFAGGQVFRTLPLYPKHFQFWWEMEYYMRGDTERAHSDGALYLTNIQQFYERPTRKKDEEPDIMTDMLGDIPPNDKTVISDFDERITQRDGLVMVLNDEAHHTHEEDSEWNKFIRRLHEQCPVAAQLDFSATPRFTSGQLFPWTVFDYPLKQAIIDGIVKRPVKGIAQIEEAKSDIASVRYVGFLTAAVERWKEYLDQLSPLKKKPILFFMMNSTKEADDVGDWLGRKYPALFTGDKTLIIHTDRKGEVSKRDLDKAREASREVDEGTSPVNAIVSVLMLREGWDVKNVTVVVGLRPYSAKANILPEQAIGRGLRLMFRDLPLGEYQERVDIIGNNAFLKFVDDLEKLEDIKLDTYKVGKDKLTILTIEPMEEKAAQDIGIPKLTPLVGRKKSLAEEITSIDVMQFNVTPLPLKGKSEDIKSFIYEGRDILTDEMLFDRNYEIPPAQTPEEVIGYYAKMIAQQIKLPSQFAALVPKVREFFEHKAFGEIVNLYEPLTIEAMSRNLASYVVTDLFSKRLRKLVVEEKEATIEKIQVLLSTTPPFPTSRKVLESDKTIFNYIPCDNSFEERFATFLDKSDDIVSFSKLPQQFGFYIQYTDSIASIRNYYPDFVSVLEDGSHWIIETKGREDIDVQHKDQAAIRWCEEATELTEQRWQYLKVLQKEFDGLHPENFEDLTIGINRS